MDKPIDIAAGMPHIDAQRQKMINDFALYVSVLPWFNIDVLHKFYLNVFAHFQTGKELNTYKTRAITCADFLQSAHVHRIDYNVFILEPGLREVLRNHLHQDSEKMSRIGEFMLSYAIECREHILSPKYREVYRIEGNLLVNPQAEAGRIGQYFANQLNQSDGLHKMKDTVTYFLNILDNEALQSGNQEIRNFLKGLNNYLADDAEQPGEAWSNLKQDIGQNDRTLSIKLPRSVRRDILDKLIGREAPAVAEPESAMSSRTRNYPGRIFAVIVGINAYPNDPLYGCVNDALAVRLFCDQLADINELITGCTVNLLLGPNPEDQKTLEEFGIGTKDYEAATRDNIIRAFELFREAGPEDICLFYFAGHGSFQAAPELFWDRDSVQVEAMVCQDSRMPGGRDLIDKELKYLLWETTRGNYSDEPEAPSLHTLVIMDCGFSSGNFQNERTGRIRVLPPHPQPSPIEDYLGFSQATEAGYSGYNNARYLQALDIWNSIRYIQMGAARGLEAAKETSLEDRVQGVFTYSLLKSLVRNGLWLSYRDLYERVKIMVRNLVYGQSPHLQTSLPEDEQMAFFGGGLDIPVTEYSVSYDQEDDNWLLLAGANAGIVPTDPIFGKTLARVWPADAPSDQREVEIISVGTNRSVLDGRPFNPEDQRQEDWVARITHMTIPPIRVFIDESINEEIRAQLDPEYVLAGEVPTFEFVEESAKSAFTMYHLNDEFVLTRTGSNIPLFRRTSNLRIFLIALQAVGQWYRILELDNPETTIRRDDLDITVEVIEGTPLRLDNLNTVEADRAEKNPSQIRPQYLKPSDKQLQPAIRVRINTTDRPYFVSCLYLGSLYGINTNLNSSEIGPDGSGAWLQFTNQGIEYRTIPISFDANYHQLGVTEITDYLKIFVSTQDFPVKSWEQDEVKLDEKMAEATRSASIIVKGAALDEDKIFDNTGDWTSFTIPVKVRRPLPEPEQAVGSSGTNEISIGGARLSVPPGFSARVSAASMGEVDDRIEESRKRSIAQLNATWRPPRLLWGQIPRSDAVFSRGASSVGPDHHLSFIELTGVSGADKISTEQPLIFEPEGGVDENEVLVAYGYDQRSGLFLPLGFSDENGRLNIELLPPPTPGKIVSDEALAERGINESVKLFIIRLILNQTNLRNHNTLSICTIDEDGRTNVAPISDRKLTLKITESDHVCLLIHGLFGDTKAQREALHEIRFGLFRFFSSVLAYDYETLNTPIEETARLLKADLERIGLNAESGRRLTIVAHGIGGLVARWWIEQEGGDQVVKQLIQVGTPNGGLAVADFRKSLFSLLALAMNGAASHKDYIPALAFMGKRTTRSLFHTLDQLTPESELLTRLRSETITANHSYLQIGGNIDEIPIGDPATSSLSKQFWRAVRKRAPNSLLAGLLPSDGTANDLAYSQASMRRVTGELDFFSVGNDHLSYFNNQAVLEKLEEVLAGSQIIDQITAEKDRQLLLVWSDNRQLLKDFAGKFSSEGLKDSNQLLIVDNDQLVGLDWELLVMALGKRKTKVLIIIDSGEVIFEHKGAKFLFDNYQLLEESENLKFGVAIREGVVLRRNTVATMYRATVYDFLYGLLENLVKFSYQQTPDLFDNNAFYEFITDINPSSSQDKIKEIILDFPCPPVKAEILSLEEYNRKVQAFFISDVNPYLVNFLINWIKHMQEMTGPVILLQSAPSVRPIPLAEQLAGSLMSRYNPDVIARSADLMQYLPDFLREGGFIVARLKQEQFPDPQKEIEEFLYTFDRILASEEMPEEQPVYLFFETDHDFAFEAPDRFESFPGKNLSRPETLNTMDVEAWLQRHRGKSVEMDRQLDDLYKRLMNSWEGGDQVSMLEIICDTLKIDRRQILELPDNGFSYTAV